jgi:hypothetical protein
MFRTQMLGVIGGLVLLASSVANAQYVYWQNLGGAVDTIQRGRLDGSDAETLIEADLITALTLDRENGHLYWASGAAPNGKLMRSDLDGSNTVELADSGATTSDIAVDLLHGKLYWADAAQGKIQRANLDGSNLELLDTVGLHVNSLKLDAAGGKMYYTVTGPGIVRRADLDGGNVESVIEEGGIATGLDLDLARGSMYYVAGSVTRADLDGMNVEPIGVQAYAVALDLVSGHVLSVDTGAGTVSRSRLDGSDSQVLFADVENPRHVAVAPLAGDFEGDGDVDVADYALFSQCLGGPSSAPSPECSAFINPDLDDDEDVDLADFSTFLGTVAG